MKEKYKVIVAHPDDEILFFNSIIKDADKIIICFSPSPSDATVTAGRANIENQLPLNNILFLKIEEMPPSFYYVDNWANPEPNKYGLAIKAKNLRNLYKENFEVLRLKISDQINEGDTIFTHNPWGEYGHEEHVQVFRVIQSLENDLKLKIYVSSYVSAKSFTLMEKQQHLLTGNFMTGSSDEYLCAEFLKKYKQYKCWTFHENYKWPKIESFYRVCSVTEKLEHAPPSPLSTSTLPLNIMAGTYKTRTKWRIILSRLLPKKIKTILKKLLKV